MMCTYMRSVFNGQLSDAQLRPRCVLPGLAHFRVAVHLLLRLGLRVPRRVPGAAEVRLRLRLRRLRRHLRDLRRRFLPDLSRARLE